MDVAIAYEIAKDSPKIDKANLAVRVKQVISRMMIGMQPPEPM